MLLRRITEHVKAQNWLAVALDFAIVVVGVFIGFQLSIWNASMADARKELVYLERLDADFDVIRERLENGKEAYSRSVAGADSVLEAIRRHKAEAGSEVPDDDELLAGLLTIGSGLLPAGSAAAFNEMVSSGELDLLKSDALRNALFKYDQHAGIARDVWRNLRDSFNIISVPIYELADYDAVFDAHGRPDVLVTNIDTQRLFEQDNLPARIGAVMVLQQIQYEMVAQQLELAEDVEALIKAELEKR